ncbi:DHH family phosphoesterase [Pseudofulvibacter geojedonensis]|uniref:Bifunctional oligoribonuclease/PAP phosphatase NrnA n=1 Tax=Pseudofulvibacter geojedonensis TaxID=1123758 RepID=A0ABW3I2A4_9FLAO
MFIFAAIMERQYIKKTKELLQTTDNVVITCHKNPDGDAIGSSLAIYGYLKKLNIKAHVIVPNNYPDFLKWLPNNDRILIFDEAQEECMELINNADVIFSLDYNALHRTGDMQSVLENSKASFIMIDHHQQPEEFAKVMYSDTSICSTCQMVYHFIDYLEDTSLIDTDIAQCIYTGIMTDTGSFRFRSTTSTTHRVIANLVDLGIDNAKIHQNVYDNNSYNRLQLLGKSLNNLKTIPELNTAYISLSTEELKRFNAQKGDTEGIVNYALSLQGVKIAAIFKEDAEQGIIKMSFRSKGDFSVNELARTHFNGGGHINAAGGISNDTLKATIDKFISILPNYKKELA